MMDKYEEFKKWFVEQGDYEFKHTSVICPISMKLIDKEFEKYLEETEKKEQIKKAIRKGFNTDREIIMDNAVERIYNSLKEGGYLK